MLKLLIEDLRVARKGAWAWQPTGRGAGEGGGAPHPPRGRPTHGGRRPTFA